MKASNVKREGGKLQYRGHEFDGFNKPKAAPAGDSHKKMVLAKKGDEVKLVKFGLRGMEDYTQHKDEGRRKNYLARSAGIKNKDGELTKNDPFSANYWARRVLWTVAFSVLCLAHVGADFGSALYA